MRLRIAYHRPTFSVGFDDSEEALLRTVQTLQGWRFAPTSGLNGATKPFYQNVDFFVIPAEWTLAEANEFVELFQTRFLDVELSDDGYSQIISRLNSRSYINAPAT